MGICQFKQHVRMDDREEAGEVPGGYKAPKPKHEHEEDRHHHHTQKQASASSTAQHSQNPSKSDKQLDKNEPTTTIGTTSISTNPQQSSDGTAKPNTSVPSAPAKPYQRPEEDEDYMVKFHAPKTKAPKGFVIGSTLPVTDVYEIGRQIGQPGQFGCAYLCTHKATGETRAVKMIAKARFCQLSATERGFQFEALRTEIAIMRAAKHPNIITFHDVFEDESSLYIVMECCSGGELFDRLTSAPGGKYSELDAAQVLRQVALGLGYLHEHNIAHCDLKPDNFLFVDTRPDAPLKIIDFGMAKLVGPRKFLSSVRGTAFYVAPEVLQCKYSKHCDMWSFGVIMFVLLFGFPPFHSKSGSDDEIFAKIKRGFDPVTKPDYGAFFPAAIPCSDAAKDLIAKCLTKDTAARLTADEALEHPWLTGKDASSLPRVDIVLKNLQEFTGMTQLKEAVLRVMTTSLSEDELASLARTFKAIDKNGDGTVTAEELKEAVLTMKESGTVSAVELDRVANLIKAADIDGDGALSYQELVMTAVQRKLKAKEERLWNAFCTFDLNHDGKVSVQEIEEVLGKDSEKAQEIIREVDQNGDGVVDYDEFVSMWRSKEEESSSFIL